MAKIVKIPLVMKNGEKATDMKSLLNNFDAESVVGYFLNGKLEKWLNDRYYEEEAEAVASLEKDDPELTKKLCAVFGVEYEDNTALDAEEIAWRNERIARLKQLTDDEEVLENVDSVAFDQEELAELYDRKVQKIYLCEGDFRIPKSKQELEYVLIGSATASGLPEKEPAVKEELSIAPSIQLPTASKIPADVADKIAMNSGVLLDGYIDLDDYIVLYLASYKEVSFQVWDKHTWDYFSFKTPVAPTGSGNVYHTGNLILLRDFSKNEVFIYNIAQKNQEIIYLEKSWRDLTVNGRLIAYKDSDGCMVIYDIDSRQTRKFSELKVPSHYVLYKAQILYYSYNRKTFCSFDTETKQEKTLFATKNFDVGRIISYQERVYLLMCHWDNNDNSIDSLWSYDLKTEKQQMFEPIKGFDIQQIIPYRNRVYLLVHNTTEKYNALCSFDSEDPSKQAVIHFRFSSNSPFKVSPPYFAYAKCENDLPVYVFNMDTQQLTKAASGCGYVVRTESFLFFEGSTTYHTNSFEIIENYLYFQRGELFESELCRVDLLDPDKTVHTIMPT